MVVQSKDLKAGKKREKRKGRFGRIFFAVFLWSVLLITYLPVLMLVVFSFSETRGMSFENFEFGFDLWRRLFAHPRYMEALRNTVLVALAAAGLATIIGTMGCVGILQMKPRSRDAVMSVNHIPKINAAIVTSFALMLAFVGTLGFLGWGPMRLVLAHMVLCVPVVVLAVLPRLQQIDKNMFEAATDLGARPIYAFVTVLIPQLMPAMVTGFLLGFTLSLDDFIVTQYNNSGIPTISTITFQAAQFGIPPQFRALSTLMFAIVIVLLVIYNILMYRKRKKTKQGGVR